MAYSRIFCLQGTETHLNKLQAQSEIYDLETIPAQGRSQERQGKNCRAVRSCSLPSGLKVHPLCLSLDIHSICLSPWTCVPCLSLPNLVLVAQFPAPYLGQSKAHPYISLKFLGTNLVGLASSSLSNQPWQRCVHAQVQGGTCGSSMAGRTYPCEWLEGQVSVKLGMVGKNL